MSVQAPDPATLKAIDVFLESIYEDSSKTGADLSRVKMEKSQIRNLESIVNASTRFSEIKNFIKNQAGKEGKERQWREVADKLLSSLETLEKKAEELGGSDAAQVLDIKMRLARGWVRQVVSHYLYAA